MVNLLLQHNANVNALNSVGQNPLLKALDAETYTIKTFKIVLALWKAKSDVNIQEHMITILYPNSPGVKLGGQTALMKAAQKSSRSMVDLLLKCGARNIKARDVKGKTACDYAIEAGLPNTAQLLQTVKQTKEYPQPRTKIIHQTVSW